MLKYSIIIPVYNVEQYLERCVDSILRQSYNNIEIILVDDGSPDKCPQICDEYQIKDSRIKVIHKKNGGLSDSRNAGLLSATGDYVLFVDSDDWLVPNAIVVFNNYLINNPQIDIAIGCLINEDGSLYTPHSRAEIGQIYSGKNYFVQFQDSISACAVAPAYRRKFLLDNELFFIQGRYHEDNDYTPRAYITAEKIVYTENEFYVRFIRDDSITQHRDKRKNLQDMLYISNNLYLYAQNIKEKDVRKVLLNRICNSYLSMFYETNIYQYKNENKGKYIDKKLVIKTAKSFYNILRSVLFSFSPRLYLFVNTTIKHGRISK